MWSRTFYTKWASILWQEIICRDMLNAFERSKVTFLIPEYIATIKIHGCLIFYVNTFMTASADRESAYHNQCMPTEQCQISLSFQRVSRAERSCINRIMCRILFMLLTCFVLLTWLLCFSVDLVTVHSGGPLHVLWLVCIETCCIPLWSFIQKHTKAAQKSDGLNSTFIFQETYE